MNGGVTYCTPSDFAVVLVEAGADDEGVDPPAPDEVDDDENSGLTVIVELFWHWLEGSNVALLVKTISAHFLVFSLCSLSHPVASA